METDAETTFRKIATGNLKVDGHEVALQRDVFRHLEPGGLPWLGTARLWYGSTLHNVEVGDADTDTGVLSSVIKQVIADGRIAAAEGLAKKGEQLINKETSFMKVGSLLVGHCKNENLATGKTTHSISLGRFGLKKVLGVNEEENTPNNPLQSS